MYQCNKSVKVYLLSVLLCLFVGGVHANQVDQNSANGYEVNAISLEAIDVNDGNNALPESPAALALVFDNYKNKTAQEIADLKNSADVLTQELTGLRNELKLLAADNKKTFSLITQQQNNIQQQIQATITNIKHLAENLTERMGSIDSTILTTEKSLSETAEKNRQQARESVSELKKLVSDSMMKLDQVVRDNNKATTAGLAILTGKIEETKAELIAKAEVNRQQARESVSELKKLVSDNMLYLAIAIVAIFLISILIFCFLRRKMAKQRNDLTSNLSTIRKSLEEELIKIDNKLVELIETQVKAGRPVPETAPEVVDHSLVIKFSDEIVRIQKNISRMDSDTKGLKQLSASLRRITDNLASNGYEIVDMLDKPYVEGIKVAATFMPNEELKKGESIITRVIKPQINFKGAMIQSAEIEVSQGE